MSGMEEKCEEEGVSRFSVEKSLSHILKNFVVEPFVFRKILVWQKIMDKRAVSHFSVGKFLSHTAAKLCGGTLLCFRKCLVCKKF